MVYVVTLKNNAVYYEKKSGTKEDTAGINISYSIFNKKGILDTKTKFTIKKTENYDKDGKAYYEILACSNSKLANKHYYIKQQSVNIREIDAYINIIKKAKANVEYYVNKLLPVYLVKKDEWGLLYFEPNSNAGYTKNTYLTSKFSKKLGITTSMLSPKCKFKNISSALATPSGMVIFPSNGAIELKSERDKKEKETKAKKAAKKTETELNNVSDPGEYYFKKTNISLYKDSKKVYRGGDYTEHNIKFKQYLTVDTNTKLRIKRLKSNIVTGSDSLPIGNKYNGNYAKINSPSKYKNLIVSYYDISNIKSSTNTLSIKTNNSKTDKYNPTKCPYTEPKSNLSYGSSGTGVKWIQWQLNKWGYVSVSIDGKFGPATKSAVLAFQKSKLLTQDGVVGKNTRDKLKKAKTTLGR